MKITPEERKVLGEFNIYPDGGTVQNPFSKEEVYLSAEALSVYDIIIGANVLLEKGFKNKADYDETYEIFYAAKTVFLANWPKEYMQLID